MTIIKQKIAMSRNLYVYILRALIFLVMFCIVCFCGDVFRNESLCIPLFLVHA